MLTMIDDRLCCPSCGSDHLHLDDTYVGGRPREDEKVVPVHVTKEGHVRTGPEVRLPREPQRRHIITLAGWCEMCGDRVAVSFEQHKGNTLVSTARSGWDVIDEGTPKLGGIGS